VLLLYIYPAPAWCSRQCKFEEEEKYSTPSFHAMHVSANDVLFGKLAENDFFLPNIPLRCRNHTIHRCRTHVYIFMHSKSPRLIGLNRPNTKYGPVGRDGIVRVVLFFQFLLYPISIYIIYIYIYIMFEILFLLYTHSLPEIPDNP